MVMSFRKVGDFLYKNIDKIELAIAFIGILLLFNRVFYGVDLTDETWYVAEPYIVANGAIPYLNNWTQAPGFTLPLFLAYKVFLYFNGSTEGIMLFSRLLYAAWITSIMILSMYIIRRNSQKFLPYLTIVPLIFCGSWGLYDISYNTIGIVYMFLVFAIVFFAVPNSSKYGNVLLIVAGIIFARAIIGTPYLLFVWVGLTILLFIQKRFREYFLFFLGNVLAAIIVIGWVCWSGTVNDFLRGMQIFIFNNAYLHMTPLHSYYSDLESYVKFFAPAFVILLLLKIKIVEKFSFDICFDNKKVYVLDTNFFLLAILIIYGIAHYRGYEVLVWIVRCVCILPFLLLTSEKREWIWDTIKNVCILDILCIIFFISKVFNVYGYGEHNAMLLFIPVTLGIACLFCVLPKTTINRLFLSVCLLIWGGLLIRDNYSKMYRDMPIKQLDTRVQSGIWKGCYTTSDRAQAVVELEKYIRSITSSKDEVMFLDWVSFGYLMAEAKACTPTALDSMMYTYKCNNPKILYDYFQLVGKCPEKLIYVHFGRADDANEKRFNKGLSIDNPSWKFNKFVNKYYDLQEVYHTKHNVVVQYEKDGKTPKDKRIIVKYYQLKKSANVSKILEDLKSEVL